MFTENQSIQDARQYWSNTAEENAITMSFDHNILQRWKKAVIHLECAADRESPYDFHSRSVELHRQYVDGNISVEDYLAGAEEIRTDSNASSRDKRFGGTALFLQENSRRYLITAKHVLVDEDEAKYLQEDFAERNAAYKERLSQRVPPIPEGILSTILAEADPQSDAEQERFKNRIYGIIFRVPSLDEYESGAVNYYTQYLWQLQVGTPDMAMSSLSADFLDLAIISLDHWDSYNFQDRKFGDGLITAGYEPISLEDIRDEPSAEGAKVFTVGFPEDIAVLGESNSDSGQDTWEARGISLPVFAFGRVSMLHHSLEYFWSDLSVFEGNSGGPVIEDGKLVGIVSHLAKGTSAANVVIDGDEHHISARTPLPFGRMIKSCYVKALLEEQIRKDQRYQQWKLPPQNNMLPQPSA